ncbi:hypothetical protein SAMN03159297_05583, partial [Pseudomonas sp. NFACC45]
LRVAQRNQRDYHAATGQWLPILRLDLAGAEGAVFGFNLQEQLYVGYEVAQRLNARYFDTAMTCPDGRASFYCNGVVLRGTDATEAYQSWNPSPISQGNNGVSTTYIRADSQVLKPVWRQGFIFKEWAAPAAYPLTMGCAYPVDAGTSNLAEACSSHGVCQQMGLDNVDAWMARYGGHPYVSCSFLPTPEQIQQTIDIRVRLGDRDWNEFMVRTWPQDIPEQLPIDAVFYGEALFPGNGPVGSRYLQDDYFKETGRFLPIVELRLDTPDAQIFRFTPEDQCLESSCPAPQVAAPGRQRFGPRLEQYLDP